MEINLEKYFGQGAKLVDDTIMLKSYVLLDVLDPNREELFDRNTNPIRYKTADEVASLILAVLYKTAAPPTTKEGVPLVDVSQSIVSQSALGGMSFVTRDGKKFIEHKFNFNIYTKGFEVFPLNRVSP